MKLFCLASLLLGLLTGCSDSTKPARSAPPPSDNYLNTLATAQKHATKTIDTAAINKALETFYVQEGHYPKDLLELVELKYLPALPQLPGGASWDYNTNTGTVTINKSGL